jgi:peptidyl-prolyl cis-trans isomerase A (cyclophilin A)
MRRIPPLLSFLLLWLLATRAAAQNPVVRFETSLGGFDAELCMEVSDVCAGAAPTTVTNFLAYVDARQYTYSIVHRSVPGFVLQGGGFRLNASVQVIMIPTVTPIVPEFNQPNIRGTIAMAQNGLGQATSQWFVNLVDNPNLDAQNFTVFAVVLGDGMTVVDQLAALLVCDVRSALGGSWGETPLRDYPADHCNPPKPPGSGDPAPPVDPALLTDNLTFVTSVKRVPEADAVACSACALMALAGLTHARRHGAAS